MSRQYSNRPFIPPRRRVSTQNYDFNSYPTSQINDTTLDSSSRQLTDSLSRIYQPSTSAELSSHPTSNEFSFFQYPSYQHTLESSLFGSNQPTNINQPVRHLNEPRSSFHFQNVEEPPTRPLLPANLATAAATTTATAPHHRHYRLENPSAASFTRLPPWFDDESEDQSEALQRSSSRNSHHTKRQRSSTVSTPTSQSSQSYHHHEHKRSRHEGINDENTRTNYSSQENVLQQQQPYQQNRSSTSHHHYQPHQNHRHIPPQPIPLPRASYNDNVSSASRLFDQRSQTTQRNRIEHSSHENNNQTNTHHGLNHRPAQSTQSRSSYHSVDHRPLMFESPPVALPRRQPIPPSRSSYTSQNHHPPHHQRNGIVVEPVPQRAPLFHRTPMTAHLHQQRPNTSSFLTDLLHRVIDAHAASYSDNHTNHHHQHQHHPSPASIDLIAYAWLSPGPDIFTLPAVFSIQFGDFFDLTIPDETPVVGLTDSELERLPTMIFTKSCTNIDTDEKCAVCLSEYIGGDKLKRLRCKHFFHSECIDPWLKRSTRCPICRGEQTS